MSFISKQSILSLGKFLLLAVVLSACGSPLQTKERIIFFSSNKQGDNYTTSVYRINPDGSGLAHLVEVPALEAILSPDGQKLAFISRGSLNNIYTINLDGTSQKQLTNLENGRVSSNPVWSPNGQHMAFTVKSGTFNTIYTVNMDGSGLKPLDNGSYEGGAAWSPDGQQIAFSYRLQEHYSSGIAVANSDGSHVRDLTDPKDNTFCEYPQDCPGSGGPVWSPDGSKIAFLSRTPDGKTGIYVVNSDGSNRIRVASLLNDDAGRYIWSPDGKRIAFVSRREGKFNIYVVMADGSGEVRLTDNASDNHHPFWSPNGEMIVFTSNRNGNWRVYLMDANGNNQTPLTNNDTVNYRVPIWLSGS